MAWDNPYAYSQPGAQNADWYTWVLSQLAQESDCDVGALSLLMKSLGA
jgi:hypothetical protein